MSYSSLNLALPILQVLWNNRTSDISHLLPGNSWDSATAKTEIAITALEKKSSWIRELRNHKISWFSTSEQFLRGWDFTKWNMTPAEQQYDGLGRRETRMAAGASLQIPKGGRAEWTESFRACTGYRKRAGHQPRSAGCSCSPSRVKSISPDPGGTRSWAGDWMSPLSAALRHHRHGARSKDMWNTANSTISQGSPGQGGQGMLLRTAKNNLLHEALSLKWKKPTPKHILLTRMCPTSLPQLAAAVKRSSEY